MMWISLPLMTSDRQLMKMNWKINCLGESLEKTGEFFINRWVSFLKGTFPVSSHGTL